MTTFDEWWLESHGPAPTDKSMAELMRAVQRAETELALRNFEYEQMNRWNIERYAAREAWEMRGEIVVDCADRDSNRYQTAATLLVNGIDAKFTA